MVEGLLGRPASRRQRWLRKGRISAVRRSRTTVSAVAVLAAFASVGAVASASGGQIEREPEMAPLTARLTGEQVPREHRFSSHIAMVVAQIRQDDLAGAQTYLEAAFGLELDASELQLLDTLYGDFDRMQQEIQRREFSRPGIEQAERTEVSRELRLQRFEHEGRVLGQWAAQLRQNGHDTDEYLRELAFDPEHNVSVSFGGWFPSPQEFEHRAMVFEDAFEAAYGRALDDVLAEGAAPSGGR